MKKFQQAAHRKFFILFHSSFIFCRNFFLPLLDQVLSFCVFTLSIQNIEKFIKQLIVSLSLFRQILFFAFSTSICHKNIRNRLLIYLKKPVKVHFVIVAYTRTHISKSTQHQHRLKFTYSIKIKLLIGF